MSPRGVLFLVILLAVFAAVFVYPAGLGAKLLPWRLGLDLVGGSHLVYQTDLSKIGDADQNSVLEGLRDVIERRVNLFGVAEPQVFIARSGDDYRLVVELAGIQDVKQAIRIIGETPFLDFRVTDGVGTSTQFVPTNLDGRYVKGAQLSFNPTTGAREVSISFNDEGAAIFERLTEENVGKPVGIFLDGQSISTPVVREKISGGSAVITGNFSSEEARELVARFNAGALPVPISLLSQQTVSATLGTDLLQKAIVAGIVGTLLVILFMIMYYRSLGVYASLALLIYIPLTLAVFKLFSVTMSLAGLAGFILTIGMAVDANILIFERMKEEMLRGLSRAASVGEGFRRAWLSIRDSNVSTIITAAILFFFTASFIKGFALTLFIGVVVSMFSAITVTRTFLRVFVKSHTSS